MTKQQIIREALGHGYAATYRGRDRQWILTRLRPSTNTRAFDALVFANLTRRLGIDSCAQDASGQPATEQMRPSIVSAGQYRYIQDRLLLDRLSGKDPEQ